MENPKVFEMEIQVEQQHLDEMNHVNNVQYLQWVQDVAKAHWEHLAMTNWLETYAWVALNHFIEYKKPAFLGERLILRTHVHEFNGVKSIRLVRIFKKETEELLVQAKTEWCMIRRDNLRPVRVPSEIVEPFFNSQP
ncbi:acyl-CoA thioesterase [Roseivirga sp.]|uniref:acyl-CoA thioesterase n=1 Tax=Roseivirga sp. TaxID=1964215 RepID=UPI003B52808E